jgi:uncharacterized heparinase superfamily protein
LSTLARYFHTVRYLRPIQIAGRIWYRARHPRPDLRAAPPLRAMRGIYVAPILSRRAMLAPDVFRFLNSERRCATAGDWEPPGATELWTYNLHYFDDLNAVDAPTRRQWHERLLERWTAEVAPGYGSGWEPYPVSRRIVNSVKWAVRGNTLPRAYRESLAVQARWLMKRLEYHILGNHLFANAKALIHAGLYFDGPEAAQWHARGVELLARQIPEQVLVDGGHFELSAMYHAMVLEDLLDVVNLYRAYGREPVSHWLAAITAMRGWLRALTHPDGDIAFFNDAAFGIAPTSAELDDYAERLGQPPLSHGDVSLIVLQSSGYLRAVSGGACLLCDCAAVGPGYLPGHAHADTLSFELSLFGRRVFVNSGTSQYGTASERQRQRGTRAHNTVVVDGEDSSEVWAGFRVARRARANLRLAESNSVATIVQASHDGYRRLPGRNVHSRRWTLDSRSLRIDDGISGRYRSAEAYFHFHPNIEMRSVEPQEILLSIPGGATARMVFEGAAVVEARRGTWHPEFGMSVANWLVVARFAKTRLTTTVRWIEAA